MADQNRRREAEKRRRKRIVMIEIIAAVFGACAIIAGLIFYFTNYTYTTYSLDAETELTGLSASAVEPFRTGNVIIGRDSVSYYSDDKLQWSVPVSLSKPVYCARGNYFALYDRGGYQLHIFDENGALGTAKVSRKICGADLSESGVTAVFTESGDSSYISYFDRYGSRISIEIKTALTKSGYPLDIAVSPDGQKLAVVYYSTDNGVGESRLVCYDFENGKQASSYITASFSDYYEADTMLVSVQFFTNETAVACGTNSFSFLSFQSDGSCSRTVQPVDKGIRSVFYTERGVGLVDETEVHLFDSLGNVKSTFSFDKEYDMILASDRRILFIGGTHVYLYNPNGKLRYDGELWSEPVAVSLSGNKSILVNDGTALARLTFK